MIPQGVFIVRYSLRQTKPEISALAPIVINRPATVEAKGPREVPSPQRACAGIWLNLVYQNPYNDGIEIPIIEEDKTS